VRRGGGAAAPAALAGTAAAPAHAGRRHHRNLPVGYPLGPFTRDRANPILRPGTQPWESKFVFNPAAVVKDGKVVLLYRAQGQDGRSSIGLATSRDGVRFTRRPEPVLVATEPYELPGGCEDPRVVLVRGTYYMTYTGYDGTSARLCLATSRDLLSWTKHGPLFPDFVTRAVDKPWSKSGAILTKPIGGRYYMYFGDKDIYWATSSDLIHWTPGPVDDPVMRPQPGTYSEELLEPGPPPLITENGYILLIHNAAARDPDGKLIYRAGQALIDPAEPKQELARLTTPFLVPETPEEVEGQVNNVVFVEGLVAYKGEWLMYYGQGDAGVGVLHGESRTSCG
jgi:predicted GH43/DUF377 family glycosyl hydrolase